MRRVVTWIFRLATLLSALACLALALAWVRSHFTGDLAEWRDVREGNGTWQTTEWTIHSGGGAVMVSRSEAVKSGVFAEMMKVTQQPRFRRSRSAALPPGMGEIDAWRFRPLGMAWGSHHSVTRAPDREDFSEVMRWRVIFAYGPVWVLTIILPVTWCAIKARRKDVEALDAAGGEASQPAQADAGE